MTAMTGTRFSSHPAFRIYIAALCVATAVLGLQEFRTLVSVPHLPQPEEYSGATLEQVLPHLLVVDERQVRADYSRDSQFGAGWAPRGGCTLRHEVMVHDLIDASLSPESCRVQASATPDPYSGREILPEDVEIDHIFPLGAAWEMGAANWDFLRRHEFANDPLNLVAVSSEENQDKSDQLPSEWMPPSRKARCWYATRIGLVAYKYQLALTRADVAEMQQACSTRWSWGWRHHQGGN